MGHLHLNGVEPLDFFMCFHMNLLALMSFGLLYTDHRRRYLRKLAVSQSASLTEKATWGMRATRKIPDSHMASWQRESTIPASSPLQKL